LKQPRLNAALSEAAAQRNERPPSSSPPRAISCHPQKGERETFLEHRKTILIVEDESTLRSVFSDMMAAQGYRCITAANAIDALQIIEANLLQFDMLVTDIKMPGGLDGVGLAKKMRELQPDAAILVITGYPASRAMKEAKARGYRVLEKPFRQAEFDAAIAEELAKKRGTASTDKVGASVTSIDQARKRKR
jgi:two-component system, cell cycle response regulator CpdR